MYKRILVPIDGSVPSELGAAEAILLARELKATVRFLTLSGDFALMVEMSTALDFERYRESLHQLGRRLLDKASQRAAEQGVAAETSLQDLRGIRVAEAIIDEAKSSRCELIVIGSHGRRGLSRAILGSDAEAVMRNSTIPVLLVHAPRTAP